MASVAMLSKEADVLTRTTLLPKRKPVISSITTRARFIKPRPNVSAIKTSKESLPPSSENQKVDDNVPLQSVEAESETLQRPAIPKRAAAIPAPPRARFQKAKPNIGSLMNKSAKDVQKSEEKSVPTSDDTKPQESASSKLDVSDVSKTDSVAEENSKKESNSSPVTRSPQEFIQDNSNFSNTGNEGTKVLSNMEKVVDMAYSVAESQPTIDIDSVCGNSQEFFGMSTITEDTPSESHSEKSFNSDVPIRKPATEMSCDIVRTLTSPRATFEVTSEKESVVLNKSVDPTKDIYPTLKSILNSPRKRTATKRVNERRKKVANFSSTPSRSEMTMVDLIYWNPSSSPMKEIKPAAPAEEDLLPADDPPPSTEETESCNIGPKVIINDDGEIILDESSLFVRRKDTVDHSVAAVVENDNTTYSSFRNRSFKTWSRRETAKFYKALSLVGTDFALMENIFKEDGKVTRTRRELKLKFKREEKSNPKFVHTAIYELQTFDLNILDEENDIQLLDESELIDDAPKQAKRSATSGTKTPGKRGRKKKSELIEAASNENTSESILGAEEESREPVYSLSNVDLQGNKNIDTESNSESAASRPGRTRKVKILSDYITDVDDLSDTNDYLDNEEEILPIKKRKRAQELSEENGAIETTDNNVDFIVDGHNTCQEKTTCIEEISPCVAEETIGTDNERKSGTTSIKKKRKLQMLPKISEENSETCNPLSDLMPETSRSGRKIKAKNMSDFIIDSDVLNDSDDDFNSVDTMQLLDEVNVIPCEENDDLNSVETMQHLDEVNIIPCEENAENLNASGSMNQLCNSTQLEGEFSIIPPAEVDGEYSGEQNIICTLDVENSNGNSSIILSSDILDQNELNKPGVIGTTETVSSSAEALSTVISLDEPNIDDLAKLRDSEACEDVDANNILTDPVVSEVVVTSDQIPRRTRRKIMPNVIKGSKRPPIPKKPLLPPRRTSFTSFTPVEEVPQVIPKINFVQSTKTYSRQTSLKQIKSEKLGDTPEYLETVQNSINTSRKRSLSGPTKSPSTLEIFRTNSMCTPPRLPLTNTPLNVLSFKSENTPAVHTNSSTELPLHAMTADPKTINMNPENSTDSPPVVILTRTPNNSNMLHLFLYQKS
ncbi:unnamed protein product [Larinioides sclopetarius]|uniref:Myb-like domain-containing protein n=1 Tax=Larinioides sclopetarius TaxID=280406 RepID=A0AAV2AFU6_9ARAC